MARTYTITGANVTLANQAVTLAFLNPPANGPALQILRCWVSQSSTATGAMQRIQLATQVSVFPTLVSATPVRMDSGDPVSVIVGGTAGAAGTCGINASAEGAGAKTVMLPDTFYNLSGWVWVPTPEERPQFNPGGTAGFGLFLPAAPATLTGWSFGITFREL